MAESLRRHVRFTPGYWKPLATVAMFGWTTTVAPLLAQAPVVPDATQQAPASAAAPASSNQAASAYSIADLEYLLGPIVLYPDPLLALILPASTHLDQIGEAARWLEANAGAVARNDFSEVDAKPWDTSVQALTRFPDVIKQLSGHPDWTESLGWAFTVQPNDVATVIQLLRAKAEKAGNLKSTPEQVVTAREEGASRVIYIAPADPERIYVPVYDSSTVFEAFVVGALVFGAVILVDAAWNNRWGWRNQYWNQVWTRPPGPGWRPPAPPVRPPPGVWLPDRPGRPNRPGVRPDISGNRPNIPGIRPDRPGVRPGLPSYRPGISGQRPVRPAAPATRPARPIARPDRPALRPSRPGTRPHRPALRPNVRPSRPPQLDVRPHRPASRPTVRPPQVRPVRPSQRPQLQRPAVARPAIQRPQVNQPRPPQGARPQLQRPRLQNRGGPPQ